MISQSFRGKQTAVMGAGNAMIRVKTLPSSINFKKDVFVGSSVETLLTGFAEIRGKGTDTKTFANPLSLSYKFIGAGLPNITVGKNGTSSGVASIAFAVSEEVKTDDKLKELYGDEPGSFSTVEKHKEQENLKISQVTVPITKKFKENGIRIGLGLEIHATTKTAQKATGTYARTKLKTHPIIVEGKEFKIVSEK